MIEEIVTECPECGSKNYFRPKDISDYPILECEDCGKRWWSD
jgi:uncharacterized Zn finger protein